MKQLFALATVALFSFALQQNTNAQFFDVDSVSSSGVPNKGQIFNVGNATITGNAAIKFEIWGSLNSTDTTGFLQASSTFTGAKLNGSYMFGGGAFSVPGATASATFNYQVRAWDSATGATHATATTRGDSGLTAFTVTLSNPGASPQVPAPDASGFTSFAIAAVPEPATITLGLFGAAGLLFRRRK